MSAINETTIHCLTEALFHDGIMLGLSLFLKSLSYIRKLMDVVFFLVILYSFTYHGYQVAVTLNTYNVQTWTGLVTTVDADCLQAEEPV